MMLSHPVESRRWRKSLSFALSLFFHGSVVVWVALGPVLLPDEAPLYNREIRPDTQRIVWYSLRDQLPAISPVEKPLKPRPPRALRRFSQTLVAGARDTNRPPQLIWTPAPELNKPQLLPSPNLVALAPAARPQPRAFVAPQEARAKSAAPPSVLPSAPELKVATANHATPSNLLPPLQAARKTFIPPVEATHQPQMVAVSLPAAPNLPQASNLDGQILPAVPMAKPIKAFVAPPQKAPTDPPPTPSLVEAPQVSEANRLAEASLAIAGLLPTARPEIPTPKASQQAGFSAGPQPRPTGGDDAAQPAQLVIPGLLSRNNTSPGPEDPSPAVMAMLEAPTSMRNLSAAARSVKSADTSPIEVVRAVRVTTPPDPRLEGRIVYALALQMPNVTSYSGSWTVWFAERDPSAPSPSKQELKPPVPLRKVDPKYVPSAAEERVEGKVRLAAVIRKNGRVDAVELLRGLDNRLDRSAADALAKWEFEPAQLNGVPIELDAVFDIPFHLAPKLTK
jgi:TonB family protein